MTAITDETTVVHNTRDYILSVMDEAGEGNNLLIYIETTFQEMNRIKAQTMLCLSRCQ